MAKKKYTYSVGCAVPGSFRLFDETEDRGASISVTCRVVEGPDAGREVEYFGSLKGGAAKYTVEALRTMGWRCNDITAQTGLGSTKVTLAEYKEEYNGKLKDRLAIFPLKERAKEVSEDSRKSFAAKFKALALEAEVAKVSELNKAPDELPAAREVEASDDTGAGFDDALPFS